AVDGSSGGIFQYLHRLNIVWIEFARYAPQRDAVYYVKGIRIIKGRYTAEFDLRESARLPVAGYRYPRHPALQHIPNIIGGKFLGCIHFDDVLRTGDLLFP